MEIYFETERLVVRRFKEEYLDDFMSYRNNMDWMKYQSFKGKTKEEYKRALIGEFNLSNGVQLAIINKENGRLIGDLYLQKSSKDYYLGFTVAPKYSRQGYIFEAVTNLKSILKELGANSIIAVVSDENSASRELLKKLGFIYSGMFRPDETEYTFYL
ncbi:MAG: GNAT family N-acetyltransferase [Clostridiaceae bacterium]